MFCFHALRKVSFSAHLLRQAGVPGEVRPEEFEMNHISYLSDRKVTGSRPGRSLHTVSAAGLLQVLSKLELQQLICK